jgi:hypothetical protein
MHPRKYGPGAKLPHKISANKREGPDHQRRRVDQTPHAASNAPQMFSHSSTEVSVRDDIIIIIIIKGHDDIHIATFRAGLYLYSFGSSRACALLSLLSAA